MNQSGGLSITRNIRRGMIGWGQRTSGVRQLATIVRSVVILAEVPLWSISGLHALNLGQLLLR